MFFFLTRFSSVEAFNPNILYKNPVLQSINKPMYCRRIAAIKPRLVCILLSLLANTVVYLLTNHDHESELTLCCRLTLYYYGLWHKTYLPDQMASQPRRSQYDSTKSLKLIRNCVLNGERSDYIPKVGRSCSLPDLIIAWNCGDKPRTRESCQPVTQSRFEPCISGTQIRPLPLH